MATLSAIFNVFVRWAIVSCALEIFGLERRAIGAPHADVEAPKSSLAACHAMSFIHIIEDQQPLRGLVGLSAVRPVSMVESLPDKAVDDTRLGKRSDVAQLVVFVGGDLAQNAPHDLA